MWVGEVPDEADDLRQGDLIEGLVAPRLALPFLVARTAGSEPRADDQALLKVVRPRYFIVVSQCCTLERGRVAALAPIRSSARLDATERRAYLNTQLPTEEDSSGYVFVAHAIESFNGTHPAPATGERLHIADFTEIQTFTGDLTELRGRRVARMDPSARRDLRVRLSAFWGRAEAEDREWLLAHDQNQANAEG